VITWTYKASAPQAAVSYSTSTLTAVSSGPTFRTFAYSGFPATKTNENVPSTVRVSQAGIYHVSFTTKKADLRGTVQLPINSTKVDQVVDQYAPADTFGQFDLGDFNFTAVGNYSFTFTVSGKKPRALVTPSRLTTSC
jgi:hypothetical protein